MRVDLSTLDTMRLSGDEDCGVELVCQRCDQPPIAYYLPYPGCPAPYGGEVAIVDSIADLVLAAVTHRTSMHRDSAVEA